MSATYLVTMYQRLISSQVVLCSTIMGLRYRNRMRTSIPLPGCVSHDISETCGKDAKRSKRKWKSADIFSEDVCMYIYQYIYQETLE